MSLVWPLPGAICEPQPACAVVLRRGAAWLTLQVLLAGYWCNSLELAHTTLLCSRRLFDSQAAIAAMLLLAGIQR